VIEETLFEAEEKMEKAVSVTREELGTIRTGRAAPSMFAKITADFYGTPTPLNQMATVSTPEPRMAVIKPFDKSTLGAIEKAIRDSDLGVNPTNDGSLVRIVFPQLTEERRKELIKVAHRKSEEGRVSIRAVRRHAKDALDKLAKDGDVGEDDVRRAEKELEELTHKYTGAVDESLRHKEAELLEV
jgi:ribosome recycling factor